MPFALPSRVTLVEAPALIAAGIAHLRDGDAAFDLGAVTTCDSSVLACLNEWRRQAARLGKGDVHVINVPEGIRRIARLYGVESLTLG
ncbi:MAG: STAS domain-containing protein [Burkholderiales bacterium]|nr:STAS domain-containing protein [Burkholderiales bacterium]